MKKRILALILAFIFVLSLSGCDSEDYSQAMQLYEKGFYDRAGMIFQSLGDYRDSWEMVGKCNAQAVLSAMASGDYVAAQTLLDSSTNVADRETLARRLKYESLILNFLKELSIHVGRANMSRLEVVSARVYDGGPLEGRFSNAADGKYPMAIVELRSDGYLEFPVVVVNETDAVVSKSADHWYCSSNIKDAHYSLGCFTLDEKYFAANEDNADLAMLTQTFTSNIYRTAYASSDLLYECEELTHLTELVRTASIVKVDVDQYFQ